MSIGSRIKELRIKNEITQEELAKIIGGNKRCYRQLRKWS